MICYKLFRQLKDKSITSLFINKSEKLELNKWLKAESYPTKGYKVRPYWHCMEKPKAPHLTMKNRIWMKVEIRDYKEFIRPMSQGGKWYLANYIKILKDEI